jgi:hypothetical protein
MDRRERDDMREAYSLDYFEDGGRERREYLERRKSGERRADWMRISKWRSLFVGKI